MTIEEKRSKLNKYCGETNCLYCALRDVKWDHVETYMNCLRYQEATEEELNLALQLIGRPEENATDKHGLHIKQIDASDVLLNIIMNESVVMIRRNNYGYIEIENLINCTIEQIRKYLTYTDVAFFIIK